MEFYIIFYLLIGLSAGFCAGLLGISGGVITVPLLLLVFSHLQFPTEIQMHLALGSSLSAMSFSTLSAMLAQRKRKQIVWNLVYAMIPTIVLGGGVGAFFASQFSETLLKEIFGLGIFCMGIYFAAFYNQKGVKSKFHIQKWILSISGIGVGMVCNLLGIGGGVIIVPLLSIFDVPFKKAVGTSSAMTFIITLTGAFFYLFFGLKKFSYPYTIGYIYLPAFLLVGGAAFIAAPLGVAAGHRLSSKNLRRIFGIMLLGIGGAMLFFN